jgi:hypothetical protein
MRGSFRSLLHDSFSDLLFPLRRGEGGPRPASSPAGAGRVRGSLHRSHFATRPKNPHVAARNGRSTMWESVGGPTRGREPAWAIFVPPAGGRAVRTGLVGEPTRGPRARMAIPFSPGVILSPGSVGAKDPCHLLGGRSLGALGARLSELNPSLSAGESDFCSDLIGPSVRCLD